MNPLYTPVSARAEHRCEYCRAPEEVFNFPLEIEHVTPQARGGTDDLTNLALACRACNLFKSDAETGSDIETRTQVTLFHPRRDVWTQHFHYDTESAQIVGLSAVGRATVARLQLNRPHQVAARHRWAQLGLFP
jgi:hypothetical protein